MARLPIDLMTVGDRANLPSGKMVVEKATAADFGGNVGAALSGLADAGASLAGKLAANEKKVTEFGYEKQFSELQEQDNLAYDNRMRSISGNADGHWQAARGETQARFNAWVKTLPEQAQAEYSARAQQLQGRRTAQAFQDQYRQQDANVRLGISEEQRKAGLAVQQQPQSYEAFVEAQEKLIDASPLTPLEKEGQKQAVRNALAYTAEQEKARRDPAAYVAGGATAGGGYREKVRSKESGGNDQAQAETSSARGRYQFVEGTWNQIAQRIGLPVVTEANRGTASDPRNNGDAQEKALDQFIKDNTAALARNGLPVTDANLYVMHFAGEGDGPRLLSALRTNPDAPATSHVTAKAASANRTIFFDRNEPRSVRDVVARLTRGLSGEVVNRPPLSAAAANLTPQQSAAVAETARVELVRQQQQAVATREAELATRRDQTYIDLKEGPSPEATYREARRSGVLTSFDDIQKAEGVMRAREKLDADFNVGAAIVGGGRVVANPYNKDHRDGVAAVYERGVKNGADPAALAASVFDRTGIVPQQFATALRGALVSEDQGRVGASLMAATNMLRQNPNAFAGVEGGSELEKSAFEFRRLTENFGLSTEQAAQRVIKDARDPALLDPVKQEQMQQFRKSSLTQEKIDARLQSKFASGWLGFGAPALQSGRERDRMASIYRGFAEEGFQQFRDPNKAMEFADLRVKQQFGVQNGVLTRYPPEKAGLPALPGAKDKHAWVNEQAAAVVKDVLGVVVEPSQVILMPVEGRDGVDTAAAFRGQPMTVKRKDGKPGQETSFQSVPYTIVVVPKTPEQELLTVNGAFFPDIDSYVSTKNKQAEKAQAELPPLTGYDQFGIPYEVQPHQIDHLKTPEQEARRAKAETERKLRDAQQQERDRQSTARSRRAAPNINTADEALLYQQLQDLAMGPDAGPPRRRLDQ